MKSSSAARTRVRHVYNAKQGECALFDACHASDAVDGHSMTAFGVPSSLALNPSALHHSDGPVMYIHVSDCKARKASRVRPILNVA